MEKELHAALEDILAFWETHCLDHINGGFIGRLDHENRVFPDAPKGCVLNARILWTFAAAARFDSSKLLPATRAFKFITDHFIDPVHGGAFWSVDAKGAILDGRKQVYALAFCIYGLSEYYKASSDQHALNMSIDLFHTIEQHAFDAQYGGYIEALTREWLPLQDVRLSAKDANEKKSMNTHLHLLEAYANLYTVWPNEKLRQQIIHLFELFDQHIIDAKTGRMHLFFDEQWNVRPDVVSYGHEIESAWLLLSCSAMIHDDHWIEKCRAYSILLVRAAMEGLDEDGGLWYEYDPQENRLVKEKHWWPQAEALVGFLNAYEVNGDPAYMSAAIKSWHFIQTYMIDHTYGEWRWGIDAAGKEMKLQDKAGFWKGPYHNGRACMEAIRRLRAMP